MNSSSHVPPSARSWRDIPQEIAPQAMSSEGRKRMALGTVRTITTVVLLATLSGGAFEIWRTWQSEPQLLAAAANSQPVRTVTVRTDGVLDEAWVRQAMALPLNITLMELDLYALRSSLMASGQVSSAVLTRQFPDTLAVVLSERSPILRLKAQIAGEPPRDFLVARDGTVFVGAGFSETLVDSLPWLAGVKLVRSGAGFAPLQGMSQVADLLVTALGNAPRLYARWHVVSLARLASDGLIVVQASDGTEIVFGVSEGFYSQLARLDLILDQARPQPGQVLRGINLAVGAAHVPVSFGPSRVADTAASQTASSRSSAQPKRYPPTREF